MNRFCFVLAFFLASLFLAEAGSSKPKVMFRVYIQTEARGDAKNQTMPVMLSKPDELITVSKIPELTEKDVAGVESWTSDDDGMALRVHLTIHGGQALNTACMQYYGKVMTVFLNGRLLYSPVIDSTISNGTLVIPRGVTEEEVKMLQKQAKENLK